MYIAAPIVYTICRKFPNHLKVISAVGFVMVMASLIAASFSNTVPQLLGTQGVLYGIGGSLHYFPTFFFLDGWFVKRKGFAFGLLFAASAGASGVVLPLLMEWLLRTWGFRATFRIWAVACVVMTIPAFLFLKRHPSSANATAAGPRYSLGFLKSPAFWILSVGNLIQCLGYFMPLLYLPCKFRALRLSRTLGMFTNSRLLAFAVAQGWSPLTGTIAISVCNGANIIGATFVGWLVDHYHVTTALNFCTVGTVFAVFLFWSFSVYQPVLYIFAITYGIFSGGFIATWAGCSNPIRRNYPVETSMIISLFTAGKGLGSIISGPLSGALVMSDRWKNHVGFAYGSGYGYLILFSGITASFASLGWFGKKLGLVL